MNTEAKKRTPSAPSKAMDEVQKRKGVPFSLKFYHGRMDLSRDKSDFFAKKVFEEKTVSAAGNCSFPQSRNTNGKTAAPILAGSIETMAKRITL